MHFNKQRISKNSIPKYVHIKIPNSLRAALFKIVKAQKLRIKELKFLYTKNQKLNQSL